MERYPTEEELETIEKWDCNDFLGLLAFVHSLWWAPDWGWSRTDNIFQISTGGWSGNEDIINAMSSNFIWWSMFFRNMRAGGHYIFCKSEDYDRIEITIKPKE